MVTQEVALILPGWEGVEGQRGTFNLILEDRQKRREGCSGSGNSVRKGLEVWLGQWPGLQKD